MKTSEDIREKVAGLRRIHDEAWREMRRALIVMCLIAEGSIIVYIFGWQLLAITSEIPVLPTVLAFILGPLYLIGPVVIVWFLVFTVRKHYLRRRAHELAGVLDEIHDEMIKLETEERVADRLDELHRRLGANPPHWESYWLRRKILVLRWFMSPPGEEGVFEKEQRTTLPWEARALRLGFFAFVVYLVALLVIFELCAGREYPATALTFLHVFGAAAFVFNAVMTFLLIRSSELETRMKIAAWTALLVISAAIIFSANWFYMQLRE